MTEQTRKMLDSRLKEIEREQKKKKIKCDKSRMFLYSVKFSFEGEDGTEYGPALPVAECCLLSAHRYVFNRMWDVAEASLGFHMTGCAITLDRELLPEEVDEYLAGL